MCYESFPGQNQQALADTSAQNLCTLRVWKQDCRKQPIKHLDASLIDAEVNQGELQSLQPLRVTSLRIHDSRNGFRRVPQYSEKRREIVDPCHHAIHGS